MIQPLALKTLFLSLAPQWAYCHQPKYTQIWEFHGARNGEEMRLSSLSCGSQA